MPNSSPDHSPHRQDEPYRRALSGIYARLAATAEKLGHAEIARHAVGAAPPYENVEELSGDLSIIHRSLLSNGSGSLARGRLRKLRRAVDVFGFHLASIDMRQNSDVHERVIDELLEKALPGTGYASLPEEERVALLLEELRTPRLLCVALSSPIRTRRPRNSPSLAKPRMRTGSTARSRFPTT